MYHGKSVGDKSFEVHGMGNQAIHLGAMVLLVVLGGLCHLFYRDQNSHYPWGDTPQFWVHRPGDALDVNSFVRDPVWVARNQYAASDNGLSRGTIWVTHLVRLDDPVGVLPPRR